MNAPALEKLLDIMARLRSEGGCPWDREQTLQSLKPSLIEETYEVIDAIDDGHPAELRDELGDLLLQIVFQARICEEEGKFRFDDVAAAICDKLIRRHPHIFGDTQAGTATEVIRNWEAIKREERAGKDEETSVLSGIPRSMPPVQRAFQVQRKAARVGFDWPDMHGVLEKVDEEIGEIREAFEKNDIEAVKGEIGDLLFAVINLCRFADTDPEEALNSTIAKFTRRFQDIEHQVHQQGRRMQDCTLDELESCWNAAKDGE